MLVVHCRSAGMKTSESKRHAKDLWFLAMSLSNCRPFLLALRSHIAHRHTDETQIPHQLSHCQPNITANPTSALTLLVMADSPDES